MNADPDFKASPEFTKIKSELEQSGMPTNVHEAVEVTANIAKATFDQFGNHVPMLFLFDEKWKQIDFLTTAFVDQADKFIFWRNAADRVRYLRAFGFVWVCEYWMRSMKDRKDVPFRELPIIGERLHVVGSDAKDELHAVTWNICRATDGTKPILENVDKGGVFGDDGTFFFVAPMVTAMKSTRQDQQRAGHN